MEHAEISPIVKFLFCFVKNRLRSDEIIMNRLFAVHEGEIAKFISVIKLASFIVFLSLEALIHALNNLLHTSWCYFMLLRMLHRME